MNPPMVLADWTAKEVFEVTQQAWQDGTARLLLMGVLGVAIVLIAISLFALSTEAQYRPVDIPEDDRNQRALKGAVGDGRPPDRQRPAASAIEEFGPHRDLESELKLLQLENERLQRRLAEKRAEL